LLCSALPHAATPFFGGGLGGLGGGLRGLPDGYLGACENENQDLRVPNLFDFLDFM
jgi:hypothetical protein